ncbi:hypothetical protein [Kibdelosporangium philippinense]|uniref:hypothetical protein n=1 Tax=Kibdelosporangium philippinense TaxID=211113 RepID=UPI003610D2DF
MIEASASIMASGWCGSTGRGKPLAGVCAGRGSMVLAGFRSGLRPVGRARWRAGRGVGRTAWPGYGSTVPAGPWQQRGPAMARRSRSELWTCRRAVLSTERL